MTESEWLAELGNLRGDLGPTRRMLVRWFAVNESRAGRSPLMYAYRYIRRAPVRRLAWEVALYECGANRGARPVAVVHFAPDAPMPQTQPIEVEVAGRIEAGGAVALVMPDGDVVFAAGPVRQNIVMGRRRL